uniref:RRM domain-containing protein n=1 Tax=Meloidogyne javanica TaxID=6303 RepID=A0A915M6S8_MELJA
MKTEVSRSRSRSPVRGRRSDSVPRRRDRGGERGNRIDHKSDKMVYLSNLPWELKWMELKDIIREKAGEVNFVEMLEDRDGRSKGCAVVEFKHREGANKCIDNMHRTELHDRLIIAKEIRDPIAFFRKVKEDTGIDFLGGGDRPERTRGAASALNRDGVSSSLSINESETFGLSPSFLRQLGIGTPLCNRVFVTNIPYNCTVGRLFDICALAGKVTWMDLQMDKEGKTKGMAVCEYSHPIEAVQAVSMLNGQRLLDRTLAVRMDRYPKDIERRDPGGLPFGLRGVGMGLGANGAPLTDVASVLSNMNSVPVSTPINGTVAPVATPLLATAVPAPLSWGGITNQVPIQTLQQVIPQQEQQIGHFQSPTQPTTFQSTFFGTQSIGQSHTSHSQSIGQSRITPGILSQFGGGSGSGSQYSTKTSPNFSSQPITQQSTVGMKLPVDYTWQIVSDRVQQFGDLESVEMITPGVAKVRFVQLKDAERAKAALQGTTVEGRMINIEYL